jgi:uracil-DNA glycosylase
MSSISPSTGPCAVTTVGAAWRAAPSTEAAQWSWITSMQRGLAAAASGIGRGTGAGDGRRAVDTAEATMASRTRAPSPVHDLIPDDPDLRKLRRAAAGCTGCDLWREATQTVFGEGAARAAVMLVGEVPGDGEDKAGRPFVGPAGRLLDRALQEAGIDRGQAYVTNVVKHFKFERRGKVRLHKKPSAGEIHACRPWLDAELAVIRPEVLVCLGATAAQALLGAGFRVTQHRGEWVPSPLAPLVTATVHPSSILRAPDDEARKQAYKGFVADLARVADALDSGVRS